MSTSKEIKNKTCLEIATNFKTTVIRDILKSQFTNPKTKIGEEVTELITELAKTMAMEAALRASTQAIAENSKIVTLDHIEKILPQMILDFP